MRPISSRLRNLHERLRATLSGQPSGEVPLAGLSSGVLRAPVPIVQELRQLPLDDVAQRTLGHDDHSLVDAAVAFSPIVLRPGEARQGRKGLDGEDQGHDEHSINAGMRQDLRRCAGRSFGPLLLARGRPTVTYSAGGSALESVGSTGCSLDLTGGWLGAFDTPGVCWVFGLLT
jgi:hypothetical protein